jgi:serine/threonine protein kinase
VKATRDKLIMPGDVELAPVGNFDPASLIGLEFAEDDWIVTRVASRSRSMIISADLAELFQSFRTPHTIFNVILHYARVHALDPQAVLDKSWPLFARFLHANWLVPEHSYLSRDLAPWYEPGSSLTGHMVEACVHVADDTQIYRARTPDGRLCAVKMVDVTSGPNVAALHQEGRILERLGGFPSPRFLGRGGNEQHRFLVMEWCEGVEVTQAVTHAVGKNGSRRAARDLLVAVLSSYATLHARQVIHGDVHPANLLVDADGRVRILDFGLARVLDDPASGRRRGGAPEYFDPDYAAAASAGTPPPPATAESEQYSLGVLCYRVATGRDYLRFPPEAAHFYEQIARTPPLSFAENGVVPWPDLENILRRSLSKATNARFASVSGMAVALSQVSVNEQPASPSASVTATRADRLIERVNELVDPNNDLFTVGHDTGPRATFMNGAAGIAYYLLRVALLTGDPAPLAAADQWAERAATLAQEPRGVYDESVGTGRNVVGSVSPYHTRSGIELVRGLVAHARGDTRTLLEAAQTYLNLVNRPHQDVDPTLGTTSVLAGYSHLVRSLREVDGPERVTDATIERLTGQANVVADHVTQQIVRQRRDGQDGPLSYTGAAHGWAGVLYTLLTWWDVANRDVDDSVVGRLSELADRSMRDGRGLRWPVRTNENPPSFMNSWCHGSPGHVYLWNAAHRALGDTAYRDIAVAAAFATFEGQGPNTTLCCGQAGHVFALLNMYRHTQEKTWLRFASERLQSALARNDAMPGGRWSHSLYRGEVGLALAAVEIAYPDEARHPLYE